MRLHKTKVGLAAGAAAGISLSLLLPGVAQADSAARSGDVVAVGSDTLQNGMDFVFDSAPGTTSGINELGNKNRIFNVFATGDANGRAVYDGTCGGVDTTGTGQFCGNTTNMAPNLLPGSVVLRDGTEPVVRPNGSGGGYAALVADSTAAGYDGLPTGSIQMVRGSRLPNAAEISSCPTSSACGGLHVWQVASDNLAIAHQSAAFGGTNAPSVGLSAAELVGIYKCTTTTWNQLPGNSGGSSATIHPLIPQSGSGTRNFFLADLQTANGGTAVAPGACVRTVEEHDPSGIYADPSPADAIEPFSTGKIAIINGSTSTTSGGYFVNGAGYAGTGANAGHSAYTPGFLAVFPAGTAGDTNPAYFTSRGLYMTMRQPDLSSSTPAQPGFTNNWAQYLFAGGTIANPSGTVPSPLLKGGTAQAMLTQAGFTASGSGAPGSNVKGFIDCGVNPATC